MTALVTGATGFVGAAVARALLAKGRPVRALARADSDRRNLDGLDVEVAEGDLRDARSLAAAVDGVETVYHVAADYRLWVPDPDAMDAVNIGGSRDLIRAAMAAGIERIVYTSSVATLGRTPDGTPADEATPASLSDMIGVYKRSKFLAEQEVARLVREEGAPVVIVNPSTPVGPGDVRPTPTGRMVADAAAGKIPAYVDTGLNIVHVDDTAEGHLLAHDKGRIGERYVLGGDDMTLKAILTEIARLCGRKPPKIALTPGMVMPVAFVAELWARLVPGKEPITTMDAVRMSRKHMYFSSQKARCELGYQSRPAGDALKDAVVWFRRNGYCG
jgi:dihydroflavonol-4-reductase